MAKVIYLFLLTTLLSITNAKPQNSNTPITVHPDDAASPHHVVARSPQQQQEPFIPDLFQKIFAIPQSVLTTTTALTNATYHAKHQQLQQQKTLQLQQQAQANQQQLQQLQQLQLQVQLLQQQQKQKKSLH